MRRFDAREVFEDSLRCIAERRIFPERAMGSGDHAASVFAPMAE